MLHSGNFPLSHGPVMSSLFRSDDASRVPCFNPDDLTEKYVLLLLMVSIKLHTSTEFDDT